MTDLISVIIPVKNGEKYIQEAIDGIKNQNMNLEIIVVDDCSNDNTVEIAKKNGCIVVKHEINRGPVAGKNTGIKIASGKYIIFHDHDDILNYGTLQNLYNEISKDDNIYAVEAMVQDFLSPDLSESEKSKTIIKEKPYYGLFTGAILMRKEIFNKIGFFNENLFAGEIIEWQHKMEKSGLTIKRCDFVATKRRMHSTNFGKTHKNLEFKDYASILRAKLLKQN